MNIAARVKELREKLQNATTVNGWCGCRQPFVFVTVPPEQYTPERCRRCGGRKRPVFVDEDDMKA